jgi:drug/metabolite transporter (DMT)-like permease
MKNASPRSKGFSRLLSSIPAWAKPVPSPGFKQPNGAAFTILIIGALCISFAPIFVRLSELPPTATAFHRMLLALPLFVLFMVSDRTGSNKPLLSLPREQFIWLILSGLLFAADLAVWHWSITYTSVANATLFGNFAPIFVTLAAWLFLGEQITGQFILGMVLALGGAFLLMRSSMTFGAERLWGDLLGIITSVFYSGYIIAIKVLRRSMSTSMLMAYSTLITSIALLGMTLLAGEAIIPSTLSGWLTLLALAWISQVCGQGLIAFALAHLPASFSSVSLLVQPVAAAILAWLILDETLTGWQGLGGLVVLAGIAVARRAARE